MTIQKDFPFYRRHRNLELEKCQVKEGITLSLSNHHHWILLDLFSVWQRGYMCGAPGS